MKILKDRKNIFSLEFLAVVVCCPGIFPGGHFVEDRVLLV
jgi:hypothetical protein